MEETDLNPEDFSWTQEPVVGTALLITGGAVDSFGNKIDTNIFYEVGKHKITEKCVIFPTERNQKHEFINEQMKRQNKFN